MYVDMKTKDLMPLISKIRVIKAKKEGKQKWSQKAFCKGICSLKAYYTFEKCHMVPKEHMIQLFLDKLNDKFLYDESIDQQIYDSSYNLVKEIEYFQENKMKDCFARFIQLLSQYKDYIYYRELLFVLNVAYKYYIQKTIMTKDEYIYFSLVYNVFNEHIEELGKDMIFKYLHTVKKDTLSYEKSIENLHLENCYSVINQLNQIIYYEYMNKNKEFLHTFHVLEKNLLKAKNYIRCIDAYTLYLNTLLVYAYGIVEHEFQQTLEKLLHLIKYVNNDIKIAQFYINMGLLYIRLDMYEDAQYYVYHCIKYATIYQKYAFVVYVYCLQRLDRDDQVNLQKMIKQIDEDIVYSKKIETAFTFMRMYIEDNDKKLTQKYFIQHLLTYIQPDDEVFIKIFRYELMQLAKQTRIYADLYTFEMHIHT